MTDIRDIDPPSIIHQDDDLVAIDKPSGLLVHPSKLAPDRITCLSLVRDRVGRWVYPVHRLDRKTSGVLLFALSSEMAGGLGKQFQERETKKTYHAICRGWVDEERTVTIPLPRGKEGEPRPAETRIRRLDKTEIPVAISRYETSRYSFCRLHPKTGRWHQIRRHMSRISYPVIGDTTHGDNKHNQYFRSRFDTRRQFLHASRLRIRHPRTGEELDLQADLPPKFREALEAINLAW